MSNNCIGCKRELANKQEVCHICGAPQSYFKFYFRSGLFFIVAMSMIGGFGYWYIGQISLKFEVAKNNELSTVTAQLNDKITQLELSLAQTQSELQKAQTAGSEVTKAADQDKQKLAAAEDKATKAEARAGWLSRENRRFRNQIAELENQIKALQAPVNSSGNLQTEQPVTPASNNQTIPPSNSAQSNDGDNSDDGDNNDRK